MIKEIKFIRENWANALLIILFILLFVLLVIKALIEPIAQNYFNRGYKLGRSECGKIEYNKEQVAYYFPILFNHTKETLPKT